jgi:hypothetical protein
MKTKYYYLFAILIFVLSTCTESPTNSENDDIEIPVESIIGINEEPILGALLKNESKYYQFNAKNGREYIIAVRKGLGSETVHTFVYSTESLKEGHDADYSDRYSNSLVKFRTTADATYYLKIQDDNNEVGSNFSVRILSPDHGFTPFAGMSPLGINVPPTIQSLLPNQIHRYYFQINAGILYKVFGETRDGKTHKYVTEHPAGDDIVPLYSDSYNNDMIEFRATRDGFYFISLIEGGSDIGSSYDIRIVSPEMPKVAFRGCEFLFANGRETETTIPVGSLVRFHFSTVAGKLYEIGSNCTEGSSNTYISIYPCVDHLVHEYQDSYSNDIIKFRQTTDNIYFIAIENRSDSNLAKCKITIHEKE